MEFRIYSKGVLITYESTIQSCDKNIIRIIEYMPNLSMIEEDIHILNRFPD